MFSLPFNKESEINGFVDLTTAAAAAATVDTAASSAASAAAVGNTVEHHCFKNT